MIGIDLSVPGFNCTATVTPKETSKPRGPPRRCLQYIKKDERHDQACRVLDDLAEIDVIFGGVSEGMKHALARLAELTFCRKSHVKSKISQPPEVSGKWVEDIKQ